MGWLQNVNKHNIIFYFSGILKSGEIRLGKIIKEKIISLFGSDKADGIKVVVKDSSTKYENGVGKFYGFLNSVYKKYVIFISLI